MTSLALYEKARAALAKATRIDEVMEVKVEVNISSSMQSRSRTKGVHAGAGLLR